MLCTYTIKKKFSATTLKLAKGQYLIILVRYLKNFNGINGRNIKQFDSDASSG
jgi:hypothetical protein